MMAADRGLPVGEIKSLTGIELSRRPETLTLEEFAKLANAFSSILRDHPSAATRSRC
jgi:hypothetical protein